MNISEIKTANDSRNTSTESKRQFKIRQNICKTPPSTKNKEIFVTNIN
jgi:hypothetical protein